MANNAADIIKSVASQASAESEKKNEETVQLVIFELDNEEYAVEIVDLQEIIRIPDITAVPNAPEFIEGIFNLRGKIVVVVDLEKRFNLQREDQPKQGNIIIIEVGANSYGVIVDRVSEIKNISKSSIQSTPTLVSSKIHADYLKGVVVIDDNNSEEDNDKEKDNKSRLIILLDFQKMLQEKELLSFGQTISETVPKSKNETAAATATTTN